MICHFLLKKKFFRDKNENYEIKSKSLWTLKFMFWSRNYFESFVFYSQKLTTFSMSQCPNVILKLVKQFMSQFFKQSSLAMTIEFQMIFVCGFKKATSQLRFCSRKFWKCKKIQTWKILFNVEFYILTISSLQFALISSVALTGRLKQRVHEKGGTSEICQDVKTVKNFTATKFYGTWHEVFDYLSAVTAGGKCMTSTYVLSTNGDITVYINRFSRIADGDHWNG